MLKVGIAHKDYGSQTLFDGLAIPGVEYQRTLFLIPGKIIRHFGSLQPNMRSAVFLFPQKRFHFFHTFNSTVLNRKLPWLTSTESIFPRVFNNEWLRHFLFQKALRSNCKAVLALSKNSKTHIEHFNRSEPQLEQLLNKTQVLYPSIPDAYNSDSNRQSSDKGLRLLFVGGEFFRKGGHIAVDAFMKLKKKLPNISLTVVSSLKETNYMAHVKPGEGERYKVLMARENITHFPFVPRHRIYEVFRDHDVLLLPSMDDSFGYTVIEAMMMGMVPVATSIRAIPEVIRDGENGILIPVKTNGLGKLQINQDTTSEIKQQLFQSLSILAHQRNHLEALKSKARATYVDRFSPAQYMKNLQEIYQGI